MQCKGQKERSGRKCDMEGDWVGWECRSPTFQVFGLPQTSPTLSPNYGINCIRTTRVPIQSRVGWVSWSGQHGTNRCGNLRVCLGDALAHSIGLAKMHSIVVIFLFLKKRSIQHLHHKMHIAICTHT